MYGDNHIKLASRGIELREDGFTVAETLVLLET